MNVIDIVYQYLKGGGYDGLVSPDAWCGCELCDLRPCDQDISECKPAYKHYTHGALGIGEEWVMSTDKNWNTENNSEHGP